MKEFSCKVLIVEDNRIASHVQSRMLRSMGCKVVLAETGEQALQLINHEFDVIFLDVELPGISGYDVLDKIRQTIDPEAKIPVAIVTAFVSEHPASYYMAKHGLIGYIVKPVVLNGFRCIMEKVIKNKPFPTPFPKLNQLLSNFEHIDV